MSVNLYDQPLYVSVSETLKTYMQQLSSEKYITMTALYRQMIGYIYNHNLADEIKADLSLRYAEGPYKVAYVGLPEDLYHFVAEESKGMKDRSEFVRCVIMYFYKNEIGGFTLCQSQKQ